MLIIILAEESFLPAELMDVAEAADQAGSSTEIGTLAAFCEVNYADHNSRF